MILCIGAYTRQWGAGFVQELHLLSIPPLTKFHSKLDVCPLGRCSNSVTLPALTVT